MSFHLTVPFLFNPNDALDETLHELDDAHIAEREARALEAEAQAQAQPATVTAAGLPRYGHAAAIFAMFQNGLLPDSGR